MPSTPNYFYIEAITDTVAWLCSDYGLTATTIKTSKNKSFWTGYNLDTGVTITQGTRLYFRGTETVFDSPYFYIEGSCRVGGNPITLFDYQGTNTSNYTVIPSGCNFKYMFNGCDALVDASAMELTATTLNEPYAYQCMFQYCTNCSSFPALPATTLSAYCYDGMFLGSGIVTPPALPATTLANGCYQRMFQQCDSLTSAPALPAPVLTPRCYWWMFWMCSSLTTAPTLDSTHLADQCYTGMFQYTNITTPPALPADTMATECYASMFQNTPITTAPDISVMNLATGCFEQMFAECTSLTTAPALPATTLAPHCYNTMFAGCTSLTEPPELPATTLPNYCYYSMFSRCSNLHVYTTSGVGHAKKYRIPKTGTGTEGSNSLTKMFSNTGGDNIGTPTINTVYYVDGVAQTKLLTVTYNGGTLINEDVDSDIAITYNGGTLATLSEGTKTLNCANKVASTNIGIGNKTLNCANKLMATDVVVNLQ